MTTLEERNDHDIAHEVAELLDRLVEHAGARAARADHEVAHAADPDVRRRVEEVTRRAHLRRARRERINRTPHITSEPSSC